MADFAANLTRVGDNAEIVVPDPIAGLVGERVLVMTYVEGVPVDDAATLRAAGHDLEDLVRKGARAWMERRAGARAVPRRRARRQPVRHPRGRRRLPRLRDHGPARRTRTRRVLRRPAARGADRGRLPQRDARPSSSWVPSPGRSTSSRPAPTSRPCSRRSSSKPLGEISLRRGARARSCARPPPTTCCCPASWSLVVKQLLYFERYAKELAPDYRMLADPAHPRARHGAAHDGGAPSRPALSVRPRTIELPGEPGGLVVHATAARCSSRGSTTASGPSSRSCTARPSGRSGTRRPTSTGRSRSTRWTPAASATTCR